MIPGLADRVSEGIPRYPLVWLKFCRQVLGVMLLRKSSIKVASEDGIGCPLPAFQPQSSNRIAVSSCPAG